MGDFPGEIGEKALADEILFIFYPQFCFSPEVSRVIRVCPDESYHLIMGMSMGRIYAWIRSGRNPGATDMKCPFQYFVVHRQNLFQPRGSFESRSWLWRSGDNVIRVFQLLFHQVYFITFLKQLSFCCIHSIFRRYVMGILGSAFRIKSLFNPS